MVDAPSIGDRFGRLVIAGGFSFIETPRRNRPSPNRRAICDCTCDCGATTTVAIQKLRSGHTTSCGCRRLEVAGELNARRWVPDGGARRIRTHLRQVWHNAIRRCHLPGSHAFADYGARGITVCAEWRSDFNTFYAWALSSGFTMGATLDRRDNDGPYSSDNCRWATYVQQNRNRRDNRLISAFGETKCLSEWMEDQRCIVSREAVKYRLSAGMDAEKALTLPLRPRGGDRRSKLTSGEVQQT